MGQLTGKVVLITGGGSGIGLEAARQMLAAGAQVAISGRDTAKLKTAATSLAAPERVMIYPVDVSRPDSVAKLIEAVNQQLGPIDILVNNAGANIKERMMRELTDASWDYMLGANLDGAFHCLRAVLPQMRQRHQGLVINVNSISGKRGNPLGGAAYVAAKFGLRGLIMAVAAEEKPNGIRFTSIYPGEVDTPILSQRPAPISEEHRASILKPEDVAAAITFVASMPDRVSIPELVITPSGYTYL